MSKELRNAMWGVYGLAALPLFYGFIWAGLVFYANAPAQPNVVFLALKGLTWPPPQWFVVNVAGAILGTALFLFLNPFSESKTDYGNASFAREKDIKKMGLREKSGVILGAYGGEFLRFKTSLSVLLVAPPGSGKTQGFIVPNLLSCPNSVIVHDPKKELYFKTGPRRNEFSKVVMFAPAEEGSAGWNPLSKKELPDTWADIQVIVGRLAATHFPVPDKGESIWAEGARSVFMFWALHLIHTYGETSIPKILEAAIDGEPQLRIAEALGIIIDEDGIPGEPSPNLPKRIRLEGRALVATPDRTLGGYMTNFKSGLNIYLDERVEKNLSHSTFSLKDLRKERTSLYVCVKNSDQTRIKTILNVFFESAILTFLDKEPTKKDVSITFFIDEMMRLGRLEEMLNAPAISRSYRVNSVFVWQSFEQITKLYDKVGIGLFKGCCAYHIYFAPNELAVAEDLSRSIGPKTQKKVSTSNNFKSFFSTSVSESWEGVPLLRPQEIMSLTSSKVIVMAQNAYNRPILSKVPYWYKDKTMKAMIPAEEDQGPLFVEIEKEKESSKMDDEIMPTLEKEIPRLPAVTEEIKQSEDETSHEQEKGLDADLEPNQAEKQPDEKEEMVVIVDEPANLAEAEETDKVLEDSKTESEESEFHFWGDNEEGNPPGVCNECGEPCESEESIGNSCVDETCQGTYIEKEE